MIPDPLPTLTCPLLPQLVCVLDAAAMLPSNQKCVVGAPSYYGSPSCRLCNAGLQALLDFDGDVEAVFCRNFQVSLQQITCFNYKPESQFAGAISRIITNYGGSIFDFDGNVESVFCCNYGGRFLPPIGIPLVLVSPTKHLVLCPASCRK